MRKRRGMLGGTIGVGDRLRAGAVPYLLTTVESPTSHRTTRALGIVVVDTHTLSVYPLNKHAERLCTVSRILRERAAGGREKVSAGGGNRCGEQE